MTLIFDTSDAESKRASLKSYYSYDMIYRISIYLLSSVKSDELFAMIHLNSLKKTQVNSELS